MALTVQRVTLHYFFYEYIITMLEMEISIAGNDMKKVQECGLECVGKIAGVDGLKNRFSP